MSQRIKWLQQSHIHSSTSCRNWTGHAAGVLPDRDGICLQTTEADRGKTWDRKTNSTRARCQGETGCWKVNRALMGDSFLKLLIITKVMICNVTLFLWRWRHCRPSWSSPGGVWQRWNVTVVIWPLTFRMPGSLPTVCRAAYMNWTASREGLF